ncbi:hypothetical protein [Streptomyces halstedii]|uniref:hypothetical protein n=1 Tax=Streptomyces halstedii TaxID=1944 RepID=UPI003460AC07
MSDAGDDEGRAPEPSGDGREPGPNRDTPRNERSLADLVLAMFADDISDLLIQAGQWLMDYVTHL